MKRLLPLCLIWLLASCATDTALVSSAPSTTVEKAVFKPCVKPEEMPSIPKTAMPPNGDVGQNAAGASADLYNYKDELKRAIVLLKACAAPPVTTPKE